MVNALRNPCHWNLRIVDQLVVNTMFRTRPAQSETAQRGGFAKKGPGLHNTRFDGLTICRWASVGQITQRLFVRSSRNLDVYRVSEYSCPTRDQLGLWLIHFILDSLQSWPRISKRIPNDELLLYLIDSKNISRRRGSAGFPAHGVILSKIPKILIRESRAFDVDLLHRFLAIIAP